MCPWNRWAYCIAGPGEADAYIFQGDLCGSIYLDQRFEEYMRSRIGHDIINKLKPKLRTEMMRTWEEKVKLFFGGSSGEDMEYEVSIHGIRDDEEKDVEDGIHKMS